MHRFVSYIILLLILFQNVTFGKQTESSLFITNFESDSYGASFSNWRITQDSLGLIYTGNLNGILEYDGSDWLLYDSISPVFEITVAKDRILVGSIGDIGYLTALKNGRLSFNTIKESIIRSLSYDSSTMNFDSEVIWDIIESDHGIYFYTKKAIYRWDEQNSTLKCWKGSKSNPFQTKLILKNNKVYCSQQGVGLIEFSKSGQRIYLKNKEVFEGRLLHLESIDENKLLIVTSSVGAVIYDQVNNSFTTTDSKGLTNKFKVFDFLPLNISSQYHYAIATYQSGLLILNKDFQLVKMINKSNGLVSNVIKQITIDDSKNLWVASIGGVSKIELGSPWSFLNEEYNLNGVVWDVERFHNNIYVGTSEGFYEYGQTELKKLKDLKIWQLQTYKKSNGEWVLLVLTDNNLFEFNGSDFKSIGYGGSCLTILSDGSILQDAEEVGLVQLKEINGSYTERIFLEKTELITNSLIEDSSGTIWLASKSDGIYQFSSWNDSTLNVLKHGYLKGEEDMNFLTLNNKTILTTSQGAYEFTPDEKKFTPINNLKEEYISAISYNDSVFYVASRKDNHVKISEITYSHTTQTFDINDKRFKRPEIGEVINFHADGDSILWIAGDKGLFRFDKRINKDIHFSFNTLIRKVNINDSILFYRNNYTNKSTLSFNPNQNNFTFNFSCTSYEAPERNQFSYYLKNNDKGWSKWSTETKKEYTNLPAGRYTFMVRAKNIYDTVGKTATYEFVILPPWYQTTWAKIGFGLLAILFVWFVSLAYTYRVRMQRRKLKLIVADRTFEVISQKKEIESQNQLLKDQFKEISLQKDEIQNKNKELEQSQHEVLTINDKLKELNTLLEKKVEQRTRKIKATLEKLTKTNKELDTFVYRASHDLKGPISRIHGLTSLGKLESTDDTTKKYYNLIEHAALDMQGLLSKLSNAYEIMNKEVYIEKIDIPSLLNEIRSSVKFLDRGTKYSFDIQEKLTLETDKYLLKIIIENLIENALIFRKTNSEHHIKIACQEKGNDFIFKIEDNGIGVAEEHINSIYEMFFRGSDQSKGSGLGLHIVKMSLEKLNGTIQVNSSISKYTQFVVTIPLLPIASTSEQLN